MFEGAINAIESHLQKDYERAQYLGKAFPNAFEANFLTNNSYVMNALIGVLQELFNDNNEHSLIEYFCFDLDFGKNVKNLKAYYQNGGEISLNSASDLYDFLVFKMANNTHL